MSMVPLKDDMQTHESLDILRNEIFSSFLFLI